MSVLLNNVARVAAVPSSGARRGETSMRRTVANRKKPVKKANAPVADQLYVEWGTDPYFGSYADAPWPLGDYTIGKTDEEIAKAEATELQHGRWAMLGCAGAWAGEVGTGIPWFKAGSVCTPEDCTGIVYPGQVIPLAPEGSGFPNFYNVLVGTVLMMGIAECARTGIIKDVFPELTVGDSHPGGEHFDPLGFEDKLDMDVMKVVEIKHARLAMLSWLGYMSQAVATNCDSPFGFKSETWPSYIEGAKGPYANWVDHVTEPWNNTVWNYTDMFFTLPKYNFPGQNFNFPGGL